MRTSRRPADVPERWVGRDAPLERIVRAICATDRVNGVPISRGVTTPGPDRWYSWAHYGVMIPGLSRPHRFATLMAIVGSPGTPIFDTRVPTTRDGTRTTPADRVSAVAGTGVLDTGDGLSTFSLRDDCAVAPDGSIVRFGDEISLVGHYPEYSLHMRRPGRRDDRDPAADALTIDTRLTAGRSITHFVARSGLYRHWSILCTHETTLTTAHGSTTERGLCTLEWARGAGATSLLPEGISRRNPVPATYFNYLVVNVDDRTQVLVSQILGPAGIPVVRRAYVRSLDDPGREYTRGVVFTTTERTEDVATPDGRTMRLPRRFTVTVDDPHDGRILTLTGTPHQDWLYGLGAGFVGSVAVEGRLGTADFASDAYLEYVDLGVA